MPEILRIEGLQQAVTFLGTFPNSAITKIDTEVNAIGDNGAKNIKGKAHRQTGKMANSVSKSKKGKMSVSVDVKVGYAGYENRKGNPHNFFDQGVQEITKDAQTRLPTIISGLIK